MMEKSPDVPRKNSPYESETTSSVVKPGNDLQDKLEYEKAFERRSEKASYDKTNTFSSPGMDGKVNKGFSLSRFLNWKSKGKDTKSKKVCRSSNSSSSKIKKSLSKSTANLSSREGLEIDLDFEGYHDLLFQKCNNLTGDYEDRHFSTDSEQRYSSAEDDAIYCRPKRRVNKMKVHSNPDKFSALSRSLSSEDKRNFRSDNRALNILRKSLSEEDVLPKEKSGSSYGISVEPEDCSLYGKLWLSQSSFSEPVNKLRERFEEKNSDIHERICDIYPTTNKLNNYSHIDSKSEVDDGYEIPSIVNNNGYLSEKRLHKSNEHSAYNNTSAVTYQLVIKCNKTDVTNKCTVKNGEAKSGSGESVQQVKDQKKNAAAQFISQKLKEKRLVNDSPEPLNHTTTSEDFRRKSPIVSSVNRRKTINCQISDRKNLSAGEEETDQEVNSKKFLSLRRVSYCGSYGEQQTEPQSLDDMYSRQSYHEVYNSKLDAHKSSNTAMRNITNKRYTHNNEYEVKLNRAQSVSSINQPKSSFKCNRSSRKNASDESTKLEFKSKNGAINRATEQEDCKQVATKCPLRKHNSRDSSFGNYSKEKLYRTTEVNLSPKSYMNSNGSTAGDMALRENESNISTKKCIKVNNELESMQTKMIEYSDSQITILHKSKVKLSPSRSKKIDSATVPEFGNKNIKANPIDSYSAGNSVTRDTFSNGRIDRSNLHSPEILKENLTSAMEEKYLTGENESAAEMTDEASSKSDKRKVCDRHFDNSRRLGNLEEVFIEKGNNQRKILVDTSENNGKSMGKKEPNQLSELKEADGRMGDSKRNPASNLLADISNMAHSIPLYFQSKSSNNKTNKAAEINSPIIDSKSADDHNCSKTTEKIGGNTAMYSPKPIPSQTSFLQQYSSSIAKNEDKSALQSVSCRLNNSPVSSVLPIVMKSKEDSSGSKLKESEKDCQGQRCKIIGLKKRSEQKTDKNRITDNSVKSKSELDKIRNKQIEFSRNRLLEGTKIPPEENSANSVDEVLIKKQSKAKTPKNVQTNKDATAGKKSSESNKSPSSGSNKLAGSALTKKVTFSSKLEAYDRNIGTDEEFDNEGTNDSIQKQQHSCRRKSLSSDNIDSITHEKVKERDGSHHQSEEYLASLDILHKKSDSSLHSSSSTLERKANASSDGAISKHSTKGIKLSSPNISRSKFYPLDDYSITSSEASESCQLEEATNSPSKDQQKPFFLSGSSRAVGDNANKMALLRDNGGGSLSQIPTGEAAKLDEDNSEDGSVQRLFISPHEMISFNKDRPMLHKIKEVFTPIVKDSRMDALVQRLDLYSKQGIPMLHPVSSDGSEEAVEWLEPGGWRDVVAGWAELGERQSQQQSAIWELVETEATYRQMIRVITNLFLSCLSNLQSEGLLTDISKDLLFSNITDIYSVNVLFWREHIELMLSEARRTKMPLDPSTLFDAFTNFTELFGPYTEYCLQQTHCQQYCKDRYHDNEHFKLYLAWCETQKECNRLRLVDILVQPMQRLTKYSLLLKAILKKTDYDEHRWKLQSMISQVDQFVSTVNSALRHRHEQERLRDTIQRIEAYDAVECKEEEITAKVKQYSELHLSQPMPKCPEHLSRNLLHQGDYKLRDCHTSKTDVHVFLFTDLLLVTKITQRKADKVKVIRPPYNVENLIEVVIGGRDSSTLGFVVLSEWGVASAAFSLQSPDTAAHRALQTALRRAKKQYSDAQAGGRDLLEEITSGLRSPRLISSRASRGSSLAPSQSGSVDLTDPGGHPNSPAMLEVSELRASSASSEDSVEAPRMGQSSVDAGSKSSGQHLSVTSSHSSGQSLPNLSVVSGNSHLKVPGHKSSSSWNRGISYPPPSPRALRRSPPVPQSRNPPLLKTRHVVSTSGYINCAPTSAHSVDTAQHLQFEEEDPCRSPRRTCRSDRLDNRRYHTAGAIDDLKKQDTKDSSIHKRLSWNYGQQQPPPPPLKEQVQQASAPGGLCTSCISSQTLVTPSNSTCSSSSSRLTCSSSSSVSTASRLMRHKLSCESVHSSSGVSSTSSLHRSITSEIDTLEETNDDSIADCTVVDLGIGGDSSLSGESTGGTVGQHPIGGMDYATNLRFSPHISSTYICHDSTSTPVGVASGSCQYITQVKPDGSEVETPILSPAMVTIDVSNTCHQVPPSAVQITVTEGPSNSLDQEQPPSEETKPSTLSPVPNRTALRKREVPPVPALNPPSSIPPEIPKRSVSPKPPATKPSPVLSRNTRQNSDEKVPKAVAAADANKKPSNAVSSSSSSSPSVVSKGREPLRVLLENKQLIESEKSTVKGSDSQLNNCSSMYRLDEKKESTSTSSTSSGLVKQKSLNQTHSTSISTPDSSSSTFSASSSFSSKCASYASLSSSSSSSSLRRSTSKDGAVREMLLSDNQTETSDV